MNANEPDEPKPQASDVPGADDAPAAPAKPRRRRSTKAVAVDASQRRQLLDYRKQVIGIARTGIDAGERAAMVAIDLTNVSLFRLIVGGMTGSLERRVEASVKRDIEPAVLQICRQLPQLRDSQQALATSVPEFRPYATLDEDDVRDCERDVRDELASR